MLELSDKNFKEATAEMHQHQAVINTLEILLDLHIS